MKRLLVLFLVSVGAILPCRLATATAEFEPGTPFFSVTAGANFPLKSKSVDAKLSGPMGYFTLVQEYQNEGKEPIKGVYTFPGSTRSAVHHSTVTIGDEVIEAKIQKRGDAARQYSDALTQGKTALLKLPLYEDCWHRSEPRTTADVVFSYINGSFVALIMFVLFVTSNILVLVASTASTWRRGWVVAPICAILQVGYLVLGSHLSSFAALMMWGTSYILPLVASTASTRRRGWVIASIICIILAFGLAFLRASLTTWLNDTAPRF